MTGGGEGGGGEEAYGKATYGMPALRKHGSGRRFPPSQVSPRLDPLNFIFRGSSRANARWEESGEGRLLRFLAQLQAHPPPHPHPHAASLQPQPLPLLLARESEERKSHRGSARASARDGQSGMGPSSPRRCCCCRRSLGFLEGGGFFSFFFQEITTFLSSAAKRT